jgi:hypothetical protein
MSDTTYKSVTEMVIDYVVTTNKQAYEFNNKMWKDNIEFSKKLMLSIPGSEAFMPFFKSDKK